MDHEQKDNTGVLFNNSERKGQNAAAPDYNGNIKVAGKDYWISGWINEGKKGKYMKLSVQVKDAAKAAAPARAALVGVKMAPEYDNSIPF